MRRAQLRDIEIIIGARLESGDGTMSEVEKDHLLQMQAILYSTEVRFPSCVLPSRRRQTTHANRLCRTGSRFRKARARRCSRRRRRRSEYAHRGSHPTAPPPPLSLSHFPPDSYLPTFCPPFIPLSSRRRYTPPPYTP